MPQTLTEMAKDLVLAQIEAHRLSPEELPQALQRTYTLLLELHAQEETGGIGAIKAIETLQDATRMEDSITKHTVTCMECGASMKQLSIKHLREHGLDGMSYRVKYGIPRKQALAAKKLPQDGGRLCRGIARGRRRRCIRKHKKQRSGRRLRLQKRQGRRQREKERAICSMKPVEEEHCSNTLYFASEWPV